MDEYDLERFLRALGERDLDNDLGLYVSDAPPLLYPLGERRMTGGGPRISVRARGSKFAPRLASGGDGENLRRGITIDTLITAPSSCASCI